MGRLIKELVKRLDVLHNRRMCLARQIVSINAEIKELNTLVGKSMDKMNEDVLVIQKMLGNDNLVDGGVK